MTERPRVVDLRDPAPGTAGIPLHRPAPGTSGLPLGRGPRVAVVTAAFPLHTQTALLGELRALHRAGRLAGIFPTRPGEAPSHHPAVSELLPYVRLLPDGGPDHQAEALAARISQLRAAGGRVDGVHGWHAHDPAAVAEKVSDLLGVPFSFGIHAADARRVTPFELGRRAEKAAGVVVCNPRATESLKSAGANVVHLPHGVDLERFRPRPAAADQQAQPGGAPARPFHVLAVGRLLERKGFGVLVDAMSRVNHPWQLRVIGDGPQRGVLEEVARRSGAGNRVELAGAVPHDAMPAHYGWADLVVAPSVVDAAGERDGLPNTVLEAMACGVAVVGTDVGSIGVVLRESGAGLVVPPGDPRPLATIVESLARNTAVRKAFAAQGRVHAVENYGLDRCTNRFVAHLEALHGRRTPAGAR